MSDRIQFQIESLQRSKIIMAVEAVAVNTAVMLGIYLVEKFVGDNVVGRGAVLVGAIFALLMRYMQASEM